ncbi:D-Ala-D-Ala carboxypeptidase family metallohydrolase [Peristeroidobacter agariperforans]|uniref:D-Ala-D-Ala carboxypeptidase family metallohydrolase n=1 Tax=Peristeroidobacter agariperforans TaxID=268404 RepID=UPI00101D11AE|nr:D-Ala-D-Ala carboxypeptidase family metallohydrolase [Peristeroidobacter agariperforans]
MPTKISEHFSLEELTFSQTAARDGINNRPGPQEIAALRELCSNILQPLRSAVGHPLTVSSGYRSPRLNRAIGGSETSQHMEGRAADLVCFNMSAKKLFKRVIELKLPFDQLIYEGGKQSIWVHVSFDASKDRRMIMLASFPEGGGVKYQNVSRKAALAW